MEGGGMRADEPQSGWTLSRYTWSALLIWVTANILSQLIFLAEYGEPWKAEWLIIQLGPWYWLLAVMELAVYALVLFLILRKAHAKVSQIKTYQTYPLPFPPVA